MLAGPSLPLISVSHSSTTKGLANSPALPCIREIFPEFKLEQDYQGQQSSCPRESGEWVRSASVSSSEYVCRPTSKKRRRVFTEAETELLHSHRVPRYYPSLEAAVSKPILPKLKRLSKFKRPPTTATGSWTSQAPAHSPTDSSSPPDLVRRDRHSLLYILPSPSSLKPDDGEQYAVNDATRQRKGSRPPGTSDGPLIHSMPPSTTHAAEHLLCAPDRLCQPISNDTVMTDMTTTSEQHRRHDSDFDSGCSEYRFTTPIPPLSIDSRLSEITQETLTLSHNGQVYTYPPCLKGVPLEKIHYQHPYWEEKWSALSSEIESTLCRWAERYKSAKTPVPGVNNNRTNLYARQVNRRNLCARQVNRGHTILDFLSDGPIHPYQLLGKQFMVGRGSISVYDTLFRLCETMYQLATYKISVDPVDWLRQRLHELIEAQGSSFNFARTIRDFYHDPKLVALRVKSGFKNIGKPAGLRF